MEYINSIKQSVKDMRLFGVMNDTKWQSVYDIFQNQEFPFLYRSKTIDGEIFPIDHLRHDVREVFPKYFASLMWLEIHSIDKQNIGKLLPPKIIDNTQTAIEAAKKAKARFTLTEYGIKIWGYTTVGQEIEFYNE